MKSSDTKTLNTSKKILPLRQAYRIHDAIPYYYIPSHYIKHCSDGINKQTHHFPSPTRPDILSSYHSPLTTAISLSKLTTQIFKPPAVNCQAQSHPKCLHLQTLQLHLFNLSLNATPSLTSKPFPDATINPPTPEASLHTDFRCQQSFLAHNASPRVQQPHLGVPISSRHPSTAAMCDYYRHIHSCKHTTYALGRLCPAAALVQTPCRNRKTWQTIGVPEGCEDCGGAALAEATPRTPQFKRKKMEETTRKDWRHGKECKDERKKFVRKVPGLKGTRRS